PHRGGPEQLGPRRAGRAVRVGRPCPGEGQVPPAARDAAEAGAGPRRRAGGAAAGGQAEGLKMPAQEMLLHLACVVTSLVVALAGAWGRKSRRGTGRDLAPQAQPLPYPRPGPAPAPPPRGPVPLGARPP